QKPLSGSGIIIDSRGVVLTNAHIAQYFLLRDYPRKGNIDCMLRTGSPAAPRYRATLLYIPTAWVEENAAQIDSQNAKGTGENDFALLYITEATEGSLSNPFPTLTPKSGVPARGDRMLLVAYPAGFLSGETIAQNLYPTSAFGIVSKKYTFNDQAKTDLFSVGASVVSQAGSSGGAAVRTDGTLAGIIATAILEGTTGEREVRAITVAHINNSLAAAGKVSLTQLLSGDLAQKAEDFNDDAAPRLTQLLKDALKD
ncbi:MAG: serine protease, partial [Patescibacteria group bacterium]